MTKFKRRSVDVDAQQFTADALAFAEDGTQVCKITDVCRSGNLWSLRTDPSVVLKFGDWVVHAVDGVHVLSDEEFTRKYEPAGKK